MPASKPKKPIGRPSGYNPKYAIQAEKLCELGATEIEIADFFEVSPTTITNWKAAHPDFVSALKSGKAMADERVERSLYHKAIGYTFDAVKIMVVGGEVAKVPYREHVPPDTTACIFWLKNRRQQQWRDVHKHEHGQPGDFDKMSNDELRALVRRETEVLGLGHNDTEASGGERDPRGKPH